jgi:hypothetical protein
MDSALPGAASNIPQQQSKGTVRRLVNRDIVLKFLIIALLARVRAW